MYTVLSPQETEEDSGVIMVAPDFRIVATIGCQAITVNDVIMMIPEFRLVMMVGSQVIIVISRMEKECGMVAIMTITIQGMVPTTITIL